MLSRFREPRSDVGANSVDRSTVTVMIKSVQKVPAGPRSLALTAAQDLVIGLMKSDLWGRLGWLEVKRRYRRTLLGPFWTSISLAIYVVAVGFVGSGLWHQEIREYLPFLTSGMLAWLLVSTIINEFCTLFVSGHALLRNVAFEYSILAYALVWRNLIIFLHNLIVYALIVCPIAPELNWSHVAASSPRVDVDRGKRSVDLAAVRHVLLALSRRDAAGGKHHSDIHVDNTDPLASRKPRGESIGSSSWS